MIFQTDRPIFQTCAVFLILAMSLWLGHDFFSPNQLMAQTSAYGYLEKGKIQWENLEIDEAIKALETALQMGLPRSEDQIEAHKILAFCWATKRENIKSEAEFQKIFQIDSDFMLSEDESPIFLEPFQQARAKVKPTDTIPPEIYLVEPEPVKENAPLKITATVTDKSGVAHVTLYYRPSDETRYRSMDMEYKGNNKYSAEFRASLVTPPGIEYYIEAVDTKENPPSTKGTERNPLLVQVIRMDNVPPKIVHRPISSIQEGEALTITATITDNTSVAYTLVYFKSQGDTRFRTLSLSRTDEDTYQAQFPADIVKPPELAYYITAKDGEGNASEWQSSSDPFRVSITPAVKEEPPPTVAKIPETKKEEPVEKPRPKKKKGSPILWIVLGAAVIGGGAVALIGGGEEKGGGGGGEQGGDVLIDPPDWPD